MMPRMIGSIVLALFSALALAQGLGDEDRDWGIEATAELRRPPYTAPTPRNIPGARRVLTAELRGLLSGAAPPLLVDVASGEGHVTLAGARWWPGVGRGDNFIDVVQEQLVARLRAALGADKARPMVFFCVNSQCWLSYNASLRAVALGYTNVLWYRGGVDAWRAAGLPLDRVGEPGAASVPRGAGADAR